MSSQTEQPTGGGVSEFTRYTRDFVDLDFTVVATPKKHSVAFAVYDIVGYAEGKTPGVYDRPTWQRAAATNSADSADTLEEAEPYLHGDIKWDGCSNWHFDEQDRVMLHACGRAGLTRIGEVMASCWDWMPELCPSWNPQ